MPKEDWGFLHKKAFEAALQASVPERLPDKVAAVTPWKRAMGRVLAGTAPPFHGTAAIQLWPVYQSDELWSAAGEVAGRVLYDRDGETFWAPYHSLEEDTSPYGYQGIYGQQDIFGTFSGHFLCPLRRNTGEAMWSMPPMKFLTQNTEMCWIAGSITAIRTDFCNIRQKRHWKTGCPIMGHFGPSGAICATAPK